MLRNFLGSQILLPKDYICSFIDLGHSPTVVLGNVAVDSNLIFHCSTNVRSGTIGHPVDHATSWKHSNDYFNRTSSLFHRSVGCPPHVQTGRPFTFPVLFRTSLGRSLLHVWAPDNLRSLLNSILRVTKRLLASDRMSVWRQSFLNTVLIFLDIHFSTAGRPHFNVCLVTLSRTSTS